MKAKKPRVRDGQGGFSLPNIHLYKALTCLFGTALFAWGAWSSVGGHRFAGEPGVLRAALGVLCGAVAVGMSRELRTEWGRYRASPD